MSVFGSGEGYDVDVLPFWLSQFDTVGLTKDLKGSLKLSKQEKVTQNV